MREGAPGAPPDQGRPLARIRRLAPRLLDHGVSLRLRLIVAASSAVAVAVLLVAAGALLTVRHELRYQVDVSLARNAEGIQRLRGVPLAVIEGRIRGVYQLLDPDGRIVTSVGADLDVTNADKAVAMQRHPTARHDATVDGIHVRVLTVALVGGGAAQITAPLDAVDATLKRLVVLLAFLVLGGIALAAALGMAVARAALIPVERLTRSAERVAATMDLTAPIEVRGADEISRLGQALNALLATVDQSQRAQRRLVADASHELRTPLTSLRTNLEILARSPSITGGERQAILTDLVAQAAELSALVGQLVDLEREPLGAEPAGEVPFDQVVESALGRARLHSPSLHFDARLQPTTVVGQAGTLERAVSNLLDNAAKWSPPGGVVEVMLADGTLSVRDHGPGIDAGDVPHVFDRCYRSARARALPGSGLGLSIVRQAAQDHGGQAWIAPAPGGGTVACIRLPVVGPLSARKP
ncbi:MAG: ATP-binding protein [Acidimicrobiales bacterium]